MTPRALAQMKGNRGRLTPAEAQPEKPCALRVLPLLRQENSMFPSAVVCCC